MGAPHGGGGRARRAAWARQDSRPTPRPRSWCVARAVSCAATCTSARATTTPRRRASTWISRTSCKPEFTVRTRARSSICSPRAAPATWRKLIAAPLGLHERILELIEREAHNARHGRRARIIAQMNSLVDPDVILALYRASQAGVSIDLDVRGICCLKPGVPGVSENIRVRALVDRFLEHARIFVFEAGGAQEVYCSSADWMPRNFHRRVEVLFPIEEPALRARIVDEILAVELRDDVKAHLLTSDGTYVRVPRREGMRAQSEFLRRAKEAASTADQRERNDRPFVVRPVRNRPTLGPAVPLDVAAPILQARDGIPTQSIATPQRDSNPEGFRATVDREGPSKEISLPVEGTS
ncbi:MAG: hypothetical protein U0353_02200 [Sandaracinus sp.]